VNRDQVLAIMPLAGKRIDAFLPHLVAAMAEFEINTPARQAAFLAQIGHESGQLRYMEEIADGSAYDDRVDLGNTRPEAYRIAERNGTTPGRFWKGHGPIQVTGYDNHLEMMMALGIDCLENPRLLCLPSHGCRAAAYFWHSRGLNELADVGNFRRITKLINGGYNHYDERQALYEKAREVLA
jgi:putative chitinase